MLATEHFDVFISYSSKDLKQAQDLRDALTNLELKPWFDRREVDDMDTITDRLKQGLANSDLVVALVSDSFLSSNPCRWEALQTLVRSTGEGLDRYALVALGELPQLWPALRGIHVGTWTDADRVASAVAHMHEKVRVIEPRAPRAVKPLLFQVRSHGLDNFVGRFDTLLQLYAETIPEHANLDAGRLTTRRKVALFGLGGVGKTAIAMKFAEDFAPAFPGGVCWINAGGDDVRNKVSGHIERDLGKR